MTTERTAPVLYLVIPCYNEEAVLPETTKRLTEKLHTMILTGLIDRESRILYVDDGSRDQTWSLISEYSAAIPYVDGVKLAHNRGHQNALLCGLMTAANPADCVISMDADLQDDTDAVDRFVEKNTWSDVVYGVRNKRDKDTFFQALDRRGLYKCPCGCSAGHRVQPRRLPAHEPPRARRARPIRRGQPVFARHCAADRL